MREGVMFVMYFVVGEVSLVAGDGGHEHFGDEEHFFVFDDSHEFALCDNDDEPSWVGLFFVAWVFEVWNTGEKLDGADAAEDGKFGKSLVYWLWLDSYALNGRE